MTAEPEAYPWTSRVAVVLGLGQAAYIARMARSSLLEVIREDYVRTARAKGLNGRMVGVQYAEGLDVSRLLLA